ncbi:hypothetical protein WJX75_007658 [Coccomyxa subellipsoidea]|uniref:BZIP domain-containing protein n=1 Tax=Coccomyxa subellipsoidea TaxID=248742 RepID=A0ABR2YSV1_9CHLO
MTDRTVVGEPNLNKVPKWPTYDSTKYQHEDAGCTGLRFHQNNETAHATRSEVHCTITLQDQNPNIQGKSAAHGERCTSALVHYDLSESSDQASDAPMIRSQEQRALQSVRNATRLEYLKRRRSRLLSKQRKLQMLQHDLYDVLVKLQALLSGETTAHPEEVASRLTCLVAEVCTIQLQAQDIHEASRSGNPPPRGTPAATCERKLPVQAMSNNGRQKTEANKSLLKSGGHAQTASRLGELILHALQSSEQGKAANREPATGSGSSQETRQGQSQPQSRAPLMHEASSGAESPKTIAARDGRSAVGPETAHGYQQIRKGERPMTAGSLPSTTAATAAVNTRPFSRHGGGPRSQRAGTQQWDQHSRGSKRPDWDDRFIVPQQHKGSRQEDLAPPNRIFRASTPDRVLREVNCPTLQQDCSSVASWMPLLVVSSS